MSARLFTDEAPKISFCTQKLTCNDNHSVIPYVIEVNTTTCKVFLWFSILICGKYLKWHIQMRNHADVWDRQDYNLCTLSPSHFPNRYLHG